jgi:FtsP/CotA-like multicopper oxidase with cupredoxin domain
MTSWKDKLALTAQRNRQEIVKAKLDRREMMRLGLLTAGGALIAKAGLSSRAFGQAAPTLTDKDATLSRVPASPPHRPWVAPMPRLVLKKPIDYHDMTCGLPDPVTGKAKVYPCDGTTPIDGATKKVNHQHYSVVNGEPIDRCGTTKFYEMEMKEAAGKMHPDYAPTKYWGFDGLVPGPLVRAKYGEPVMIRFKNHLPSVKVPQAFGIAEISTHLHNAHTPSESDGNPVNYINSVRDPNPVNPDGFKDQHYPNIRAGFTARGDMVGDPAESLGSLWFHDHHLDFTAQNVYKGMFGCYNLFDELDTGEEGTGLNLPCKDYDIPIFFNDFLFDRDCQTVFDLFNLDGILGDRFAANGAIQPYLNVKKRRYRFRLYAPGPARWWEWALWDGKNYLPFWQISTDGNLLPNAVQVSSVRLSVAERVDIIVDFAKIAASGAQRLYLVNRAEQINGRGPTGRILSPGTPVLQINLTGSAESDSSADPAAGAAGPVGMKLRPLPDIDFAALQTKAAKLKTRTWRFERGSGGWTVNGKIFDERVVDASIPMESEEVWIIQNPGGSWRHPVHIHYEEHRILSRNGTPVKPNTQVNGAIDYARRDVVNLQTNEEVRIFMRFRDMKGRYVMHCHNVVHEDHAMMVRFDIV